MLQHRRIRHAGYAALAWAVVQLVFLPMPLAHTAQGWQVEWSTLLNVAPTLILALAVLRRSVLAAGALGAYGAYRLLNLGIACAAVLDGSAARLFEGPGVVWAAVMASPFAVMWVRGGVGAFHLVRDARRVETAAG